MIRSSRLLLRYETPLVIAPGPSSATKPPLSGLRRRPASSSPSPTFAHGPRCWQASTPWPSGASCRTTGQRGPPLAVQRVGTTSPGRRARAERAAAKIGRVCLCVKKTHIGLGAIVGGVFGRFYARRYPVATGANVGNPGRKKDGGRRGEYSATARTMQDDPAWHSTGNIIAGGTRLVKRRRRT